MIEAYIGPDAFRRGLAAYFERTEAVQRDGRRSLALPVAGLRNGCRGRRAELDRPEGLPAAAGARHLRQRQADARTRRSNASASTAAWTRRACGRCRSRCRPATRRRRDSSSPTAAAKFATGPCTAAPLFIDSSAGFFRVQYPPDHLRRLAHAFPEARALGAPRAADRHVRAGAGGPHSACRILRAAEPAAPGARHRDAGPVPAGRLRAVEPVMARCTARPRKSGTARLRTNANWDRCWAPGLERIRIRLAPSRSACATN